MTIPLRATLLGTFLLFSSAEQPTCVPPELRALDEAQVVLHELPGPSIELRPEPTPGGAVWQSVPISRSVSLSPPQARELLRLIGSAGTYEPCVSDVEGGVVGCGDPNYALTVTLGSRRLELLVMLECRRIELWRNGKQSRTLSNLSDSGISSLARAFCQQLSNTKHACSIAKAK